MTTPPRTLDWILGPARKAASKGNAVGAQNYLRYATEVWAPLFRVEIPGKAIKEIEQTANQNYVPFALSCAERAAFNGDTTIACAYLQEARDYASKASLDITAKVRAIEASLRK